MSSDSLDYFFTRLSGRVGSSTVGALGAGVAGASPNAGGALPKSLAAGVGVGSTAGAGVGAAG
jgi:hypothetical protein